MYDETGLRSNNTTNWSRGTKSRADKCWHHFLFKCESLMSQIFSLTLTKPSCIFYLFWIICCADIIPVLLNWGCASACSTMFSVFVLRTYKIYTYTNTIYKFWHFSWFLFYSCVIKWTAAFPIWLHSSGCRERQQTTTEKHLNNIQSIASLRCTIITQYYKEKKNIVVPQALL